MKTTTIAILAAAWLGATAGNVHAQTNASSPRKFFARTNSVTATVQSIDYDKRELTLKTPGGAPRKFGVSEDVQRFSEIKKGDTIRIAYYESLALSLGKPGSALTPTGAHTAVISREPGKKPGGVAASVIDVTATVEKVDPDLQEVTLRGPRGNVAIVEVDPEIGNLQQIHKGDRIAISYTEALAVSVEKP